jgi:trigger factor
VTVETIAPVRTAVIGEFQRQANLPGFRKGKAPANLVEQRYAKEIHDETLQRVTRQAIEQAAKEHDLKPVGPFELNKADYAEARGLSLEAVVEVEPSFTLAEYKNVALTRRGTGVSQAEIDKALQQLQESMSQMQPVPQPGTPPAGGVGAGDTEAEGRSAKTPVLPPIDDDLAKDLGHESLAKLTEHVKAKLTEQKKSAQASQLESDLCERLLSQHTFEVPAGLVARQADRLARDFKMRLLLSGIPEAKVEEEVGKFTDQLKTTAARHVKLSFILDRIADRESVAVTQDELVKRLFELARRWRKDPAEVRKTLDAQGLWNSVASAIRQEKTINVLLAAAAIKDEEAKVA